MDKAAKQYNLQTLVQIPLLLDFPNQEKLNASTWFKNIQKLHQ
jgi:hypothetical protein